MSELSIRLEKNEKLGLLGEKLVMAVMRLAGREVDMITDYYDQNGDLTYTHDGKTIEVKTQAPYLSKNCLTFRKSQLRKVKESYQTIFVNCPISGRTDSYAGHVMLLEKPAKIRYTEERVKDRNEPSGYRDMILVNRENLKTIFVIEDLNILDDLRNFSASKWGK